MSTEADRTLTRLYATLGAEAQYAPLQAPEDLRRRGDRRRRSRTVLVVAAAAALVIGAAAGGNELLGRDHSRVVPAPPVPAPSASPTVPTTSASPTAPPPSTTSASRTVLPAPPPTSVPDTVFLTAAEINDDELTDSAEGVQLPSLCDRGLAGPSPVLVRARTGDVRQPGVPAGNVPDAILHHSVARYASTSRARQWMDGLREAVAACPVRERGNGGRTLNRLLPDPPAIADDVVFIEERQRIYDVGGEKFTDSYSVVYTVAIRHGDAVAVIHTKVFEDFGFTGPRRMRELAGLAGERLVEWRGEVAPES